MRSVILAVAVVAATAAMGSGRANAAMTLGQPVVASVAAPVLLGATVQPVQYYRHDRRREERRRAEMRRRDERRRRAESHRRHRRH